MNKGEMVLINYTGRTDGEIFDTTVEQVAEENDLHREDANYKEVPVLIGKGYVIDGLEEALLDMEVGDTKEVEVSPDKAYGPRDSENIKTYPEKEFKKQGVDVRPGEDIMIGRRRGKVISASSGRVRIDFNHPLSGKTLNYDLEVVEKVEDDEEIARKIYSYRIGHGDIEIEDGKVKIPGTHSHGDHEHELSDEVREKISGEIEENTELEVEFV